MEPQPSAVSAACPLRVGGVALAGSLRVAACREWRFGGQGLRLPGAVLFSTTQTCCLPVLQHTKSWLAAVPWSAVVQKNEELCRSKGFTHRLNPKTSDTARLLWDPAGARPLTLGRALELCRRCNELIPFILASDQTFVAIGHDLTEDLLQRLSPVEAQILRSTVGHYIAGLVARKELEHVFRHFERHLVKVRGFNPATGPVTAVQPQGL